jgi:hypothetical protein
MASSEDSPDFLFVEGRGKKRRGIQSFINSRRLRNEVLKKSLTTRSNAPVGWVEQPRGSADLHTRDPTLRKVSSDQQSDYPMPGDVACEETESSQATDLEPPPPSDTDCALVSSPPTQSLLTTIERELIHVDPFANLPIQLDRLDQALYRFSMSFLTEEQFGTSLTNPTLSRSVGLWPHYNSQIRVCATLLITSAWLDQARSAGPSKQTIRWKVNLIRCLNRIISNEATRYGNDAVNGVVLLLLLEVLTPGSQHIHLHSRALMQLFSRQGSRGCLSDHIDVALAILTSKAQIAYLDHLQPGQAGIAEASIWRGEVNFTIATLRDLSDWVLQSPREFYGNPVLRDSLFLQSIREFNQPTDTFELSQQMFALCYVAVVIWECRGDIPECIRFLQVLSAHHERLRPDRPVANTSWVCIRGIDNNKNNKLQYQAIRLMRVFHRLTDKTQSMIRDFLTGLCGVVAGSSIGIILTGHVFMDINKEALSGLPRGWKIG